MERHGLVPYPEEWWHHTLKDEPFPDTYFAAASTLSDESGSVEPGGPRRRATGFTEVLLLRGRSHGA